MGAINVVNQSVKILTTREEIEKGLKRIEECGRICYQSDSDYSNPNKFISRLISMGHESVLEHLSITAVFITDRGTSHQLVRHRLSSFSQESQRYCCYLKDRFDGKLQIVPPQAYYNDAVDKSCRDELVESALAAFYSYNALIICGLTPEDARSVLPQQSKTQIAVTANIRQWRAIFRERCDKHAQAQIRALMIALKEGLKEWSFLFDDIEVSTKGIFKFPEIPTIKES